MKLSNEEIAAKDLRVGNWVQPNTNHQGIFKGYRQITTVYAKDAVVEHHYPLSWFDPIPLTPKILERCGAFDTNGTYQLKIYSDTLYIIWHPKQGLGIRVYKANGGYIDHNFKTQYVHQLQNLYYSLTGEELDLGIAISKNEVK